MNVVIIVCAGGVTSSLLCNTIKKASLINNINIAYDTIANVTTNEILSKYKQANIDLLLLYCGANQINTKLINTIGNLLSGIFIAPQLKYYIPQINDMIEFRDIECNLIDMKTFCAMDGIKMLNDILSKIHIVL